MKTIKLSTELLNTQTAGLDAGIAKEIKDSFAPFFEKLNEKQDTVYSLVVTKTTEKLLMSQAKEMRLKIRDIRTAANDLRVSKKEQALKYGNAIQSAYNSIETAAKEMEAYLKDQETFAERMEQIRINELRSERNIELYPLREFVPMRIDVGLLPDEDYAILLAGCIASKEKKEREEKEAQEQAERNRLAEIERVKQAEKDRAENEKLQRQLAKAKADKDKLLAQAAKEKEDRDAADRKAEQDRHEAAQAIEQERKNKLLAEAKLQQMQADKWASDEAKRIADEQEAARIEAAKNGNDEAKLDELQGKIKAILSDLPECTSKDGIATLIKVRAHLKNAHDAINEHYMPF